MYNTILPGEDIKQFNIRVYSIYVSWIMSTGLELPMKRWLVFILYLLIKNGLRRDLSQNTARKITEG